MCFRAKQGSLESVFVRTESRGDIFLQHNSIGIPWHVEATAHISYSLLLGSRTTTRGITGQGLEKKMQYLMNNYFKNHSSLDSLNEPTRPRLAVTPMALLFIAVAS